MRPGTWKATAIALVLVATGPIARAGFIYVDTIEHVPGYKLVRTAHTVAWLDDGTERTTSRAAHWIETVGGENDGARSRVPERIRTSATSGTMDAGEYTVGRAVIRTVPATTRPITIAVEYASDLTYHGLPRVGDLTPVLTSGSAGEIDAIAAAAGVAAQTAGRAAEDESAATDAGFQDALDERSTEANSPVVGDPVVAATGQFQADYPDLTLGVGGITLELGRTHRSSASVSGSFGPGWSFSLDSRLVFGVSTGAATAEARVLAEIDRLLDPRAGAVADVEAAVEASLALRRARRRAADAAASDARELEAALRGVRYSGVGRSDVNAALTRRADLAAALARSHEAESERIAREIATLISSTRPAALARIAAAAESLAADAERLGLEADRARSYAERNARFASTVASDAAVSAGNGSVTVVGADGYPRRYVMPAAATGVGESELLPAAPSTDRLFLLADGSLRLDEKGGTMRHYGPYGELRRVEDRNGNAIDFGYDTNERLVTVEDSRGRRFELERDLDGLVTLLRGPGDVEFEYAYGPDGTLAAVTDAVGDTVAYEYEGPPGSPRIVRIVQPDGSSRGYRYELVRGRRRTVETRDEEGAVERFDYPQPGLTRYENPSGVVTWYRFDENNRLTRVERHGGGPEVFTYSARGDLIGLRSPSGAMTRYAYDARHNRTSVVHPDLTTETWTYGAHDRPVTWVDRRGLRTEYRYDGAGNLVEIAHPDGTADRFTRVPPGSPAAGAPATHINRIGNRTVFTYDERGYPSEIADSAGPVARLVHDAYGRVLVAVDGEGVRTGYEYRRDGRVASVSRADDEVVRYEYSKRKDLTSVDAYGRLTSYAYDRRHLPVAVVGPAGDRTVYEYRADGRLVARESFGADGEAGVRTEWEYDEAGLRSVERVPGIDASILYEHDSDRRIVAIVDAVGTARSFAYAPDGRLREVAAIVDRRPVVTSLTHYPGGPVATRRDPNGGEWTYVDDPAQRRSATVDPDGRTVIVTESDPYGRPLLVTDGAGRFERYEYDLRGRLVAVSNRSHTIVSYEHDSADRVTRRTDGEGATWRYEYDAHGRPAVVRHPDGSRSLTEYNPDGTIRRKIDGTARATAYEYDEAGRLSGVVDAAGHRTSYAWTHTGAPAAVTDATGRSTSYSYDAGGRLVGVTGPAGGTTRFELDAAGRLLARTDPTGRSVRYAYDELGRVTSVGRGATIEARYRYDAAGNLTHEIDGVGRVHGYEYDAAGRLASETNRLGARQTYGYDSSGRTTSIVDFNGVSATLAYSDSALLSSVRYSDGSFLEYGYDRAGRLTSARNESDTVEFAYDPAGRLESTRDRSSGFVLDYTYDAAGRRLSRVDHATGHRIDYRYDERGLLDGLTDSAAGSTAIEYDAAGRRTSLVAGNGVATRTSYDAAGRVSATVVAGAGGIVLDGVAHLYDEAGRRRFDIDHNADVTAYSYDERGRLSRVRYPFEGAKRAADFARFVELGVLSPPSGLSDDGQVPARGAEAARSGGTEYLSYLSLSRADEEALTNAFRRVIPLQKSARPTDRQVWTESFAYNEAGDRTEWRTGWGRVSYTFDSNGRLAGAGAVTYSHDMAGNLTEILGPGGSTTYRYSARHRLISAVSPSASVLYSYDALGRRSSRTERPSSPPVDRAVSPVLRKPSDAPSGVRASTYHYDGVGFAVAFREESSLIALADGSGLRKDPSAPGARFRPAHGSPASSGFAVDAHSIYSELVIGRDRVAVTGPTGTRYLGADLLGSVRVATDASASVTARYSYDAFGSTLAGVLDSSQPYGFTGKPHDPVTGLRDHGYRDYHPTLARFTTPDPIRDGTNWYIYANADPVNFTDPRGLSAVSDSVGAGWGLTEFGHNEDPARLQEKDRLQQQIRELEMYQPGGGGNYNRSEPDLTWCNQACFDYSAATAPALFYAASGGRDRTRITGRIDPSYNTNANATAERLARAAAIGSVVASTPSVAEELERYGIVTTIREASGQHAQELANQGYAVIAAKASPIPGASGHLSIVARSGGEFDPGLGPLLSNVGQTEGELTNVSRGFSGLEGVRYFFDENQVLTYIDNRQSGNSIGD